MKSFKVMSLLLTVGILALAFVTLAPMARADQGDQSMQLTFSQPVQLPGDFVLPAGTYWFVMPNYAKGGEYTDVYDVDWSRHFGTFLTVTTERQSVTSGVQLAFAKVSEKKGLMLVSWFYPGESFGHELIYSPQEESQIREGNQFTVMARKGPIVE
jgi:hypothetical protein